jgi:predicted RNA-binding Zn-ribbon protein involved in translation (DUF1610 family)
VSDFISLTCPVCGGKLSPAPGATSLVCQHCGTEHLIRHEAGTVILEAFARCPQCSRNDKVEKVTAILASQTHEIAEPERPADVAPVGPGAGNIAVTSVAAPRRRQMSVLAQKLALPLKPTFTPEIPVKPDRRNITAGIRTVALAGIIGLSALASITLGLVGVPPQWLEYVPYIELPAGLELTNEVGLIILGVTGLMLCAAPVLIAGALWGSYSWGKYQQAEAAYREKLNDIQMERERRERAWQQAVERWNQLYYCYRDDCVFIPGAAAWAPLARMADFISPPQ